MKLRNAIIGINSVVVLIGLSLVVSISHSLATARPVQGTMIGQAPVGEIVLKYVGKTVGGNVGYLTYIAGYDGPYFSDPTTHNETTAYFTFRVTGGGGNGTKIFRVGNLASFESEPGGGIWTTYFNPTPHGNYAMPDTFSDGIMIRTAQYLEGQSVSVWPAPGSTTLLFATVRHDFLQTFAGSFSIGGETYTFGAVGDRSQGHVMVAANPTDPTIRDYIAHTTALAPAP
jgi:hypothetical protein